MQWESMAVYDKMIPSYDMQRLDFTGTYGLYGRTVKY